LFWWRFLAAKQRWKRGRAWAAGNDEATCIVVENPLKIFLHLSHGCNAACVYCRVVDGRWWPGCSNIIAEKCENYHLPAPIPYSPDRRIQWLLQSRSHTVQDNLTIPLGYG
jgi:hypothetical protein